MKKESECTGLFELASRIDSSLESILDHTERLAVLRVHPERYNRQRMFEGMMKGDVVIFSDFPSPYRKTGHTPRQRNQNIVSSIARADIDYKVRTRLGTSRYWRYFAPQDLMSRWLNGKSAVNVTDLHIRGTSMERTVNPSVLSGFNLLPEMSDEVSWIEMMTMVISGKGGFSDSHSDDCDGTNHCFTGKKLWLVWDTLEGIDNGLQDLDKQKVNDRCKFDPDTFLSLSTSRWFTVESGLTLFLPGHLTHKVITIEPYLGMGSFYLSFANIARTLKRWETISPNWNRSGVDSLQKKVFGEIIRTASSRSKKLSVSSQSSQEKWGVDLLEDGFLWNGKSLENASRLQ